MNCCECYSSEVEYKCVACWAYYCRECAECNEYKCKCVIDRNIIPIKEEGINNG